MLQKLKTVVWFVDYKLHVLILFFFYVIPLRSPFSSRVSAILEQFLVDFLILLWQFDKDSVKYKLKIAHIYNNLFASSFFLLLFSRNIFVFGKISNSFIWYYISFHGVFPTVSSKLTLVINFLKIL